MTTLTDALHNSNLHAVFATTPDHKTYRVSDPADDRTSHNTWDRLDTLRREGRLPQVKFFEVRSVTLGPDRALVGPEVRSHDRYDKAPLNLRLTQPVVANSKGFGDSHGSGWGNEYSGRAKAARAAWQLRFPTFRSSYDKRTGDKTARTGTQGNGGWYFYPNGTTAAQGLESLGVLAERRGFVVEGGDGRWYVVDVETLVEAVA